MNWAGRPEGPTVRRRVALFTANRAEYGLQYPILSAVASDERLDYLLVAGGSHLDAGYGRTLSEMESDGFVVHRMLEMPMERDTLQATAKLIGMGVVGLADAFREARPDFLVVTGDRSEAFAAVIAGSQMGIPTAHVEGGDYTEGGALDDSVRHAMTKLAHIHFATNGQSAERIRKLGEEPWRVFTVGLPMLDMIASGRYAPPDEVATALALNLKRPIVAFCQHSITSEYDRAQVQVRRSLQALRRLAGTGYQIVITYPNSDAGGQSIVQEVRTLESVDGIQIHKSLGTHLFHGLLNVIGRHGRGALVGNSSAGNQGNSGFRLPVREHRKSSGGPLERHECD